MRKYLRKFHQFLFGHQIKQLYSEKVVPIAIVFENKLLEAGFIEQKNLRHCDRCCYVKTYEENTEVIEIDFFYFGTTYITQKIFETTRVLQHDLKMKPAIFYSQVELSPTGRLIYKMGEKKDVYNFSEFFNIIRPISDTTILSCSQKWLSYYYEYDKLLIDKFNAYKEKVAARVSAEINQETTPNDLFQETTLYDLFIDRTKFLLTKNLDLFKVKYPSTIQGGLTSPSTNQSVQQVTQSVL